MPTKSRRHHSSRHRNCACGSNQAYQNCCRPILKGEILPDSPEVLMRSRFVAYTKANIAYIERTMCGPAASKFDACRARKWAKQVQWLGLQVLSSQQTGDEGVVEFIATYMIDGKQQQIHERSQFRYLVDRWYYYAAVTPG